MTSLSEHVLAQIKLWISRQLNAILITAVAPKLQTSIS